MNETIELQTRLKELLERFGLNENKLAKETGVPQSTMNRMLKGTTPDPRLSTLRPLAKYFKVSLGQLIGEEPLPEAENNITIEKQTRASTEKILLNHKLIDAVEKGKLEKTKDYIQRGADFHLLSGVHLHTYNEDHDTLLHIAVLHGHVEIVEYLLELDCNANLQNRRKRTPLHYAMYEDNPKIIELLLKHGADTEIPDNDEATAFLWACYLNQLNGIDLLLAHYCNYHTPDKFGRSPLGWACAKGNQETIDYLLQHLNFDKSELRNALNDAVENAMLKSAERIKDAL